jgi:hypothetical protein
VPNGHRASDAEQTQGERAVAERPTGYPGTLADSVLFEYVLDGSKRIVFRVEPAWGIRAYCNQSRLQSLNPAGVTGPNETAQLG